MWPASQLVRPAVNRSGSSTPAVTSQPGASVPSRSGGAVYAAVNPIVDLGLAGASRGELSFEPAATICYVVVNLVSVGVEYYADFGPIGDWSPARDQQHYLYEVINVLRWKRVERTSASARD